MDHRHEHITYLWEQYINGKSTPEELSALLKHNQLNAMDDEQNEILEQLLAKNPVAFTASDEVKTRVLQRILQEQQITRPHAHRVHFLKTTWFRYAAAIIVLFGIGAYLWKTQRNKPKPAEIIAVQDVPAPGTNRATLTLANGQTIYLDSINQGVIAKEGEIAIEKTRDGDIIYQGASGTSAVQYNVLSVPRGSQVASIILSDGSKVFLNAASSLKYPVVFSATERRIEITGEAYFEVAKDAKRRFIVIGNNTQTEVLGTSFNVNAYTDEPATKITLIEGKVKVSSNKANIIIQPGQQVENNGRELQLNKDVDIAHVIGWQKGVFILGNLDMPSMLRQVSRWYNIDIEMNVTTMEPRTFSGVLSRKSPLSEVINILNSNGIKCRLEGKKLVIGK